MRVDNERNSVWNITHSCIESQGTNYTRNIRDSIFYCTSCSITVPLGIRSVAVQVNVQYSFFFKNLRCNSCTALLVYEHCSRDVQRIVLQKALLLVITSIQVFYKSIHSSSAIISIFQLNININYIVINIWFPDISVY